MSEPKSKIVGTFRLVWINYAETLTTIELGAAGPSRWSPRRTPIADEALVEAVATIVREQCMGIRHPEDDVPAWSRKVAGKIIAAVAAHQPTAVPPQPALPGRCKVCDWPLTDSTEKGRTADSCAYRPPVGSDEYHRIKRRRAELAEPAALPEGAPRVPKGEP